MRGFTLGSGIRALCAGIALVSFAASPASATIRIIGGLGNFDVYNESEGECTEFEIELEGPDVEDVYHTYRNGNYGSPVITALPGGGGILVRYSHPRHATAVHGLEHFGVSLNSRRPVTAQRFRWVNGSINPPYPPPAPPPPPPPLAVPTLTTEIVDTPQGQMVRDTLVNVDPLGRTIWILRRETESMGEVQLEQLMPEDPLIEGSTQVDVELERLVFGIPLTFEEDAPGHGEVSSEVISYEVYSNVRANVGGQVQDAPGAIFGTILNANIISGDECTLEEMPTVFLQPVDTATPEGTTAEFAAEGIDPLGNDVFYQWRYEGQDMPGETGDTLVMNNITLQQAGIYSCVITTGCGTVLTNSASLTVTRECDIDTQPAPVFTCIGEAAVFEIQTTVVSAFEWRFRDGVIPADYPGILIDTAADGKSSRLRVSDIEANDAGNYECVVTNNCGSTYSTTAPLVLCIADTDCDGDTDSDDILEFFGRWDSGSSRGDVDGDSDTDSDDIIAFFARWETGC